MSKLKYVKIRDILALFQFFFVLPIALIAKLFVRNFWLICEDRMEARDNGFWLFKYIRETYPEQKIAYAIDRNSVDYDRVRKLGKIVQYGSWSHWFWYLTANTNISSQKGGKPNAAVCYLLEVKIQLLRNKRCFLQHGTIKDDLKWLYYRETRLNLFVCGAKPEYEFVKEKFQYPDGVVQYCGLARFDQLHDFVIDENLILVMPTWREWIARDMKNPEEFRETQYFIKWSEFLNSPELDALLAKYEKRILFFPHRNMQKYLHYFGTTNKRIEIAGSEKYDIQEILKKSALMITDYSSVFFDFAYMKKPILFYQFDEEEFRKRQYEEGYFDYHNNSLGVWGNRIEDILFLLEQQIQTGFLQNDHVTEFFELYDTKNCERNYLAIKECK